VKRAVVLIALAACGGKAAPAAAPPAPAAPAAARYRLDWSPPCRVPVIETFTYLGRDVVTRYAVDVTPLREGELAVTHVGHAIISIEGVDYTVPARAQEAAALAEKAAIWPTLVIGVEGELIRVEGVDEVIERFVALEPPERREATRTALADPGIRTELEHKFTDTWEALVVAWISGSSIERVDAAGGLVHLRQSRRIEGEEFLVVMTPTLETIFARMGAPADAWEDFLDTVEGFRETENELTTTPGSLRATHASWLQRTVLSFDDREPVEQTEERAFELDWERAVGCGK
jgi:hypothetical protein